VTQKTEEEEAMRSRGEAGLSKIGSATIPITLVERVRNMLSYPNAKNVLRDTWSSVEVRL
jgi:hypothetical protein